MAAPERVPKGPGDLLKNRPSLSSLESAAHISSGTCKEMQHSGREKGCSESVPGPRNGALLRGFATRNCLLG